MDRKIEYLLNLGTINYDYENCKIGIISRINNMHYCRL